MSASAATRVDAARAWLDAQPVAAEFLVIGASWDAADDLVRAAALAQGARFGTTRLTLGALAGILATPALAAAAQAPAGGMSLDAIAARAVHALAATESLGYFSPVARCPGFPRAVARTVEELRMAGVDAPALRAGGDVGAAMDALVGAILREMGAAGVADRAAVFAAACDAVTSGERSPLLDVPLVLLDVPLHAEREAPRARARDRSRGGSGA